MRENRTFRKTLHQVFLRVKPHWTALITVTLLAAVYVAMSLYIPILVGRGIDQMLGAGKVNMENILQILLGIAVCALVAGLAQWGMSELNNKVTYRVTKQIRDEAFDRLQKMPVSYLDKHAHGDIVSRMITDVDTFADGLLMGFTQLFSGVITILGTLGIMLSISWQIALVVVCITPISLLVANLIAKSTYDMFRKQTSIRGEQTALIDESVEQIKVIRAFGHQEMTLKQFDTVNEELGKCSLRAIFYSSLTNPSTRFVNSLVYAGVAFVGTLVAIGGGISVGGLTSFLNYANQYTKPFNEISGVITELQNAVACAGRVFDLIEAPVMDPDPADAQAPDVVCGGIKIEDLSFSYSKDKPFIEDLNLQIQPGKKIAIVGPTGCGKTTVINLLMRFYDPDRGRIYLDGVNILEMSRHELRRNIGMVLQDTWLKAGTIRENISMGNPDATLEQIVEAAKQAYAHSFIKRLPQGYDTVITEQGGNLSQGQKQLLCIARVMLSKPPILFLDEATSSIDTRTELKVQKAFDALMQGRTSFVVAHRLSTIEEADLILVMRDGKIVEQGRHQQLLIKNGFYSELYNSQFAH